MSLKKFSSKIHLHITNILGAMPSPAICPKGEFSSVLSMDLPINEQNSLEEKASSGLVKTEIMITSATEFIRLRESDDLTEQHRASNELAEINIWLEVIEKYPDFKWWVIHNKKIQIEILELLSNDPNPEIRSAVARKRMINKPIKDKLSKDPDENVRFALISNTKLNIDELKQINVEDSVWLKEKLEDRIKSTYS